MKEDCGEESKAHVEVVMPAVPTEEVGRCERRTCVEQVTRCFSRVLRAAVAVQDLPTTVTYRVLPRHTLRIEYSIINSREWNHDIVLIRGLGAKHNSHLFQIVDKNVIVCKKPYPLYNLSVCFCDIGHFSF